METPKVSVVISTYNRSNRLKRAVASVLAQSFQDFEIIIVDDASTDATQEVVNGIHDKRLLYIKHTTNKGGSAARNTGIKIAQGPYIGFLDDDDQWLPQKLEKQFLKMNDAALHVGLIYGGSEIYDENKKCVTRVYPPQYRGNVYQHLLLKTILSSVSSALVKKECFEKVGVFDEKLTSCQDWDMWLRIAQDFEFDYVPEVLTRINIHTEHISTNYQSLIPGRTRMVEKHWEAFKSRPEILLVHLKRLGKLHCINGTWKEALPWFKKAVEIRPFELIKILTWCIVELPYVKFFSPAKNFKRYTKSP